MEQAIVKNGLVALAIGVGASQTALASDMPVKSPVANVAPASVYKWTGFYAGGNIGYGWGHGSNPGLSVADTTGAGIADYFNAGGFPIAAVSPEGAVAGGQFGYNWQSNALVWALVADIQWSGLKSGDTYVAAPPPFITGTTSVDRRITWFGTVRGKLGWAMQNWMPYATGGLAYGRVTEDLIFTSNGLPSGAGSNNQTKAGWTAGAGLEYGWGRWSFGVEYLYLDLGKTDATIIFAGYPGAETDSLTVSSKNTLSLVRALVNYRF